MTRKKYLGDCKWQSLIEEFAVDVGTEKLGARFGKHLTGNHVQAVLQSVVDTNSAVESSKFDTTTANVRKVNNSINFHCHNCLKCAYQLLRIS